jgi:hypothetical protein
VYLKGLNAEQRKKIADTIAKQLWYFDRLTGRMHQTRFPRWDPLKIAAEDAKRALQEVYEVVCGGRRND